MKPSMRAGGLLALLFLCLLPGRTFAQGAEPMGELLAAEAGVEASYQTAKAAESLLGVSVSDPTKALSSREFGTLSFDSPVFSLFMSMSANSDGRYSAELANVTGGSFGQIYVLMEEGGLQVNMGSLHLKGGRLRHYDIVDSPYSLFVNAQGRSAPLLELSYAGSSFFFASRWIELNRSSTMQTLAWTGAYQGFPDRGANIKFYGLKVGEMSFGIQDAAVYTGKWFDLEYFLNPLPQYFIQYSKTTSGRPWYADTNENNLIGAFWTWDRPGAFSSYAQVLVDDFNLYALGIGYHNPWKAAFSLGGRLETGIGRIGLHAAGATQFTFSAIGMSLGEEEKSAYGYTYYPDTIFNISKSGAESWSMIGIEDNALGYQYGENNLALQADWSLSLGETELGAALEFRLAGTNSAANPWADWNSYPEGGTRWLEEDLLEKRILFSFFARQGLGDLEFYGRLWAGAAVDALALRASTDADGAETPLEGKIPLWAPKEGLIQPILKITFGAKYRFRIL